MAASTEYTDTLKKIKETEQQTVKELAERKKALEDELRKLEEESAKSIASARAEADEFVEKEVDAARASAQAEADRMLAEAGRQAAAVAQKKVDKKALSKTVDEILAEFREG